MQKLIFSDLLREREPDFSASLCDLLDKYSVKYEFIKGTKDIWMRDFMPLLLEDNTRVSYIYNPNYLKTPKYKDTRTIIEPLKNHMNLVIDGGNFVRYKNKAIMTDKIFEANHLKSKDEILQTIKNSCKLDELIIVPKQPDDWLGHADSMVRWIDENRVVVNDFSFESKTFNAKFEKALSEHNLEIIKLNLGKDFEYKKTWCYLNFIKVKNVLFVPTYGAKTDEIAIKQLENIFSECIIEPIRADCVIKNDGALHCISAEI